eukprot:CAMPEP_0181316178 /NCGR_PEP_ID=MMETSP1101-20121128/15758_1 /TAXON_ID=46948 /ORGANISM="Rhodomonas abbreviata, Strain Caron Lab Isolate" /LENGTH=303 /DNA_ID=CAMNT_0023423411 /DNA_START=33 /DNA_END=944 /DNA_ORIENTATION=-
MATFRRSSSTYTADSFLSVDSTPMLGAPMLGETPAFDWVPTVDCDAFTPAFDWNDPIFWGLESESDAPAGSSECEKSKAVEKCKDVGTELEVVWKKVDDWRCSTNTAIENSGAPNVKESSSNDQARNNTTDSCFEKVGGQSANPGVTAQHHENETVPSPPPPLDYTTDFSYLEGGNGVAFAGKRKNNTDISMQGKPVSVKKPRKVRRSQGKAAKLTKTSWTFEPPQLEAPLVDNTAGPSFVEQSYPYVMSEGPIWRPPAQFMPVPYTAFKDEYNLHQHYPQPLAPSGAVDGDRGGRHWFGQTA